MTPTLTSTAVKTSLNPPTILFKENLHNVLTRQICRDIQNAFKTCRMYNLVLRVSSPLLVFWVSHEWHHTL